MLVVVIALMTLMEQDGRKQQEPPNAATLQYMFVGIGTPALACMINCEL
jgi:hypothetical protein